ncbi:MAG: lipopolysaccharide assembly protein LapA domain-containing protein [Gaiellaceae bacterium]
MTDSRPSQPSEHEITGPDPPGPESRRQRLARSGHRTRLYLGAVLFLGSLVILIVLSAANTRSVKLDWVLGSTHASLVWIILGATVLGWLLGIATSVVFRYRTRRRV